MRQTRQSIEQESRPASPERGRSRLFAACLACAATVVSAAFAVADCPPPEQMRAQLERLDLGRGARTAKFEMPLPTELYEKAFRKVGKPYTTREGNRGEGVIVAEVPVAAIWKALNDENRHGEAGSPIPVRHSEVIEGRPRGESRVIFQYAKQMGFGRWWVSRVWMNRELFESSGGQLWELLWEDQTSEADPDAPPMNRISGDLDPVQQSQGAWLLVPLAEACTLVEYFNWSDPGGGLVGFAQPMIFSKGLRRTVAGMVELADEYRATTKDGHAFLLPDGSPLD
jgi:hypothetical protein